MSFASTWTRVLQAKDHTYILCITAEGAILMYLVPALSISLPEKLPHVQVAPIARETLPGNRPVKDVSAWGAGVPSESG